LAAYHGIAKKPRINSNGADLMQGAYLGPSFAQDEIEKRLRQQKAVFETVSADQVIDLSVKALAQENAVGWFQGRMEFGPRALGARSILGDARSPSMQSL